MTAAWPLFRAEMRAAGPIALLVVGGLLGTPFMAPGLQIAAWGLYLFGSLGIGVAIVAHDLDGPTVGLVFGQPIGRDRLLAIRWTAAIAVLLLVAASAWWAGLFEILTAVGPLGPRAGRLQLPIAVLASGLFVAPLIAIATRSAIAAVLGAAILPPLGFAVFERLGDAGSTRFPWTILAGSVVCAALLRWRFHALEDCGAPHRDFYVGWRPAFARRRPAFAPSRRWLAALTGKELRLQQAALIVAGIALGASLLARALSLDVRSGSGAHFATQIYAVVVAILVGATASAEERRLGTLPWQVVLATSRRRQFLVKVAVVAALVFGLSIWLPALTTGSAAFVTWPHILGVSGAALAAFFVSSLSPNGLRAFLATLPFCIGLVALVGFSAGVVAEPLAEELVLWLRGRVAVPRELLRPAMETGVWTAIAGLVAMLSMMAYRNHHRPDLSARHAVVQLAIIAAYAFLAAAGLGALFGVLASSRL